MNDETESYRRARLAEINDDAGSRADLEDRYWQVWNSDELRASSMEVIGFMAPFVVVRDLETGKRGSLEFQHSPRFYFNYHGASPKI